MKRVWGSNLGLLAFGILVMTSLLACGQNKSPVVEAISSDAVTGEVNEADLSPAHEIASKIIGIHALVPVKLDGSNVDAPIRNVLNAFGIISIGTNGSCTGTHIGNGYVITAGHCFLESPSGGVSVPIAINKPCPTIRVDWGYRGSPQTGSPKPVVSLTSMCTNLVYAELTKARDFAIFKVDKAPSASIPVSIDSKRPAAGTKITILGYPKARPLEWSQYCALVDPSSVQGFSQIASGGQFLHQCDTEPGNSGSAIIATTSTGVLRIVGIHDSAGPGVLPYNVGTYIFDAREAMLSKGINLDSAIGALR